jgi:hypothetical protein
MNNKCNFMKRSGLAFIIILAMTCLLVLASCSGGSGRSQAVITGPGSAGDTASIFFTEYEHNLGNVIAGEKIAYVFSFENRGNGPLVISSATTSCGCTVSKYSTRPITPGGKGTLEVTFDSSGRNGKQTKTITVRSNATRPVVLLKITCEVLSGNNN